MSQKGKLSMGMKARTLDHGMSQRRTTTAVAASQQKSTSCCPTKNRSKRARANRKVLLQQEGIVYFRVEVAEERELFGSPEAGTAALSLPQSSIRKARGMLGGTWRAPCRHYVLWPPSILFSVSPSVKRQHAYSVATKHDPDRRNTDTLPTN